MLASGMTLQTVGVVVWRADTNKCKITSPLSCLHRWQTPCSCFQVPCWLLLSSWSRQRKAGGEEQTAAGLTESSSAHLKDRLWTRWCVTQWWKYKTTPSFQCYRGHAGGRYPKDKRCPSWNLFEMPCSWVVFLFLAFGCLVKLTFSCLWQALTFYSYDVQDLNQVEITLPSSICSIYQLAFFYLVFVRRSISSPRSNGHLQDFDTPDVSPQYLPNGTCLLTPASFNNVNFYWNPNHLQKTNT